MSLRKKATRRSDWTVASPDKLVLHTPHQDRRTVHVTERIDAGPVAVRYDSSFALRRIIQIVLLSVLTVYRLSVIVNLIVAGQYDSIHFTYWSYLAVWTFFASLLAAYVAAHRDDVRPLYWVTILGFPMVSATAFTVMWLIVIILDRNGSILLEGTTAVGGTLPFGLVEFANFLLHTLPSQEFLVVLLTGYIVDLRGVAYDLIHGTHHDTRWIAIIFLYWVGAGTVFVSVYVTVHDPSVVYPTDLGFMSFMGMTVLLVVVWFGIVALSILAHPAPLTLVPPKAPAHTAVHV